MLGVVSNTRPGCQFDQFLYASVGDDANGMPLTVLSALARMDVDPWDEAEKLTQLPRASAVTQLVTLLAALRHAPVTGLDPALVAAPLIALLPCPRDRALPMLKALPQAAQTERPAVVSTLLTAFAYLIFMLLGQWLMGSLQAPTKTQPPQTSASTIDSPNPPASSEGPQSPVR